MAQKECMKSGQDEEDRRRGRPAKGRSFGALMVPENCARRTPIRAIRVTACVFLV